MSDDDLLQLSPGLYRLVFHNGVTTLASVGKFKLREGAPQLLGGGGCGMWYAHAESTRIAPSVADAATCDWRNVKVAERLDIETLLRLERVAMDTNDWTRWDELGLDTRPENYREGVADLVDYLVQNVKGPRALPDVLQFGPGDVHEAGRECLEELVADYGLQGLRVVLQRSTGRIFDTGLLQRLWQLEVQPDMPVVILRRVMIAETGGEK